MVTLPDYLVSLAEKFETSKDDAVVFTADEARIHAHELRNRAMVSANEEAEAIAKSVRASVRRKR